MDVPTSDLPAHQLQELFKLQSGANTNKTLVNLQLAATHIAYMIQRQPDDHVRHRIVALICYIESNILLIAYT
jgi:hypothetical protein